MIHMTPTYIEHKLAGLEERLHWYARELEAARRTIRYFRAIREGIETLMDAAQSDDEYMLFRFAGEVAHGETDPPTLPQLLERLRKTPDVPPQAVRGMHYAVSIVYDGVKHAICNECYHTYPCGTVRALDGAK